MPTRTAARSSSFLLLPLTLALAVGTPCPRAPGAEAGALVTVDPASVTGFRRGDRPWRPFGCNYFDPHVGWAPKLWRQFDPGRVEEHFRKMSELGIDAVRVFLTAATFFPDGETLDETALGKLDRLLEIADRHAILVHPTGPDHWEGTPAWRRGDLFADPKVLAAQARFWKLLAARYRDDARIFAFDLLNEPHVGWRGEAMEAAWKAWLRDRYPRVDELKKAWGGEAEGLESADGASIPPDEPAPGSRRLADYQEFREWLGERWTRVQAEAIRSSTRHLITVGLIQWSVPVPMDRPSRYAALRPSRIERYVDFQSVHFYPLRGDPSAGPEALDANLAYLELVLRYVRGLSPGKPLVVGEFGWFGGGAAPGQVERTQEDQARWCRSAVLQGRGLAVGWLNWALADTPTSTDITRYSGLFTEDLRPKAWGEAFRELARSPEPWLGRGKEPEAEVTFPLGRALVDPPAGTRALDEYTEAWKTARGCRLRIAE